MITLTLQEFNLLTNNPAAQGIEINCQKVQELEKNLKENKLIAEKAQEQVLQVEQKIKDTKFEILRLIATVREIQVAFIKNRGYDPGDLPIKFKERGDGTYQVLIG